MSTTRQYDISAQFRNETPTTEALNESFETGCRVRLSFQVYDNAVDVWCVVVRRCHDQDGSVEYTMRGIEEIPESAK